MKKIILWALAIVFFVIFFASLLLKKSEDIRVINVSGFEAEELELKRKYGDKKTFTAEELETMNREINALNDKKIKKYKEEKKSKE